MPVWKNILCAIDFSTPSRFALLQAAELAASHGAELRVLHVREIPPIRAQLGMLPPPEEYDAGELWRQLERARVDVAEINRVNAAVEMAEGTPADHIVRIARERDVDLVVLGTHGRTGLRRAVIGSVAEQVVRRAHCSVLVARPEALVDTRAD
jgi:nucleotide-binding universal stress UspA family protein